MNTIFERLNIDLSAAALVTLRRTEETDEAARVLLNAYGRQIAASEALRRALVRELLRETDQAFFWLGVYQEIKARVVQCSTDY